MNSDRTQLLEKHHFRRAMTHSPYADGAIARGKVADSDAEDRYRAAQLHLRFAAAQLGVSLSPGATILDFGCGIGISVSALLADGYNAFGVDVLEYWDRDFDKYWHIAEKPPADVANRVRLVDLNDNRLPFEDGTFDFCFSDQVFEHVFDYAATMSEIVLVLKPGAISVHRFPGPNQLMEGHIHLPFPVLCFCRPYLMFWAWMAWIRGTEPDWRDRVRRQIELMRFNNYPSKAKLRRVARSAGVEIEFKETEEFQFRGGGRFAWVLERLRRIRMDRMAIKTAGLVLQRYMILRSSALSESRATRLLG